MFTRFSPVPSLFLIGITSFPLEMSLYGCEYLPPAPRRSGGWRKGGVSIIRSRHLLNPFLPATCSNRFQP